VRWRGTGCGRQEAGGGGAARALFGRYDSFCSLNIHDYNPFVSMLAYAANILIAISYYIGG